MFNYNFLLIAIILDMLFLVWVNELTRFLPLPRGFSPRLHFVDRSTVGWEGPTMLIRLNWHCNPTYDTFLESLGPQKLFRNSLHNIWSPSEWSGRSKVSIKKSFGGFWLYWCRLWHYSPIYDTFLELLGQWKYLWVFCRIFCHH